MKQGCHYTVILLRKINICAYRWYVITIGLVTCDSKQTIYWVYGSWLETTVLWLSITFHEDSSNTHTKIGEFHFFWAIRNIQMFKTLRHTIYISCCKIQRKRKKCKRNKQVCKAEIFASRTINTPLHAKTCGHGHIKM